MNRRLVLICTMLLHTLGECKINIKVNDIADCHIPKSPMQKNFTLSNKLMKSSGNKYLQANVTLLTDVDESFHYTLLLLKWDSKAWTRQGDSMTGNICSAIIHQIPTFWKTLAAASKPKLSNTCPVKAGSYFIERFVPSPLDMNMSLESVGHYLLHIEIRKDETPVLCKLFDIEGVAN